MFNRDTAGTYQTQPDSFAPSAATGDLLLSNRMLHSLFRNPCKTVPLGLQINTTNRDLMRIIKNTYKGLQAQGNNRRVTFVIE